MYSKESFAFKFFFPLLILYLVSCSGKIAEPLQQSIPSKESPQSRLLVSGQIPAPSSIRSLQLYREGDTGNPPIIELDSEQKLVLAFDELTDLTGQFRIDFYHYDPSWNRSNIPPDWYLAGVNELVFGSGTPNRNSNPSYIHYQTRFPNSQVDFKISGNYMLVVRDFRTNTPLFSLPFYVTENAGEMSSSTETIFNIGRNGAAVDQPFTEYFYPEFVVYPQFDLRFFYVQNRFWGSSRQTETFDISEEGRIRYYLKRQQSFPANYDFLGLNVNEFGITGPEIMDWQPEKVPPLLILRDDYLNFSADPVPRWRSGYGQPRTGRDIRYSRIRFRFNGRGELDRDSEIYLLGDFNQWTAQESTRLIYDVETGTWEGEELIKQGRYTYKYAVKDAQGLNEIRLGDAISRVRQEYTTFVYFLDPDYLYYRLLRHQTFSTR